MLPPSEHYQYFSHLFHSKTLTPYTKYEADAQWRYPDYDQYRFSMLFEVTDQYVKDQAILDLGCHTGFLSYIAKLKGAKSVHGVNAREFPIAVANYAFSQLNQTDYKFEVGDIENLDYLKQICENKDTVILTGVLEHLRNPYALLDVISNSSVKHLIFESYVFSESGEPALQYYKQSTNSDFTVYEKNKPVALGCTPNTRWIETVLYHLGWRIEQYDIVTKFDKNWFAIPNLTEFTPFTGKMALILATKFENSQTKENWEKV